MDLTVNLGIAIGIYIIVELVKKFIPKDSKYRELIPTACALVGGIAGVVLFFVYPSGIPNAPDAFQAFITGGFSGAAATGSNQIYKRISSFINTTNGGYYEETSEEEYTEDDGTNYGEDGC